MGGCRCTYRNCTIRSDGVTHMFHYPVFDKVRCHQWLTNAQKLNFLNLKVSQLKNRVVCQHHFRDENFMNYMKDKLTFDAVPTKDGPYCDSKDNDQKHMDVAKEFPISQEDIENEFLTLNEKRANFSLKYGDFLTNCELMDLNPTYETINNSNRQIKPRHKSSEDTNSNVVLNESKVYGKSNSVAALSNSAENNNNLKSQYMQATPSFQPNNFQNSSVISIDLGELQQHLDNEKNTDIFDNNSTKQTPGLLKSNITENKVVRIISEEKITGPSPVIDKLKPIPQSFVLRYPKRKKYESMNETKILNNSYSNTQYETIEENKNSVVTQLQQNEPLIAKEVPKTQTIILKTNASPQSRSRSVLKSNLSADRVAAIEEKRKFNMKLRDIVQTCLDKLEVTAKDSKRQEEREENSKRNTVNVGTLPSQDLVLPSSQDSTMAYLEDRIKRMEENLLNKIDQNSHKIIDLKKSLLPLSGKTNRTTFTQTFINEESHKKHLYQEISKYLSPEANNLIYEELFINKYSEVVSKNSQLPKRRKRR